MRIQMMRANTFRSKAWSRIRRMLVCAFLGAVVLAGVNAPGLAQEQAAATTGKKPAILIIDATRGHREYWNPLTLQEMLNAGYEVGQCPSKRTPTDEELKQYNIALVCSIHADFATDLQPKLEKFMKQGGGVLVTTSGNVVN
ncbi:MAG: hypothetical protein KKD76_04215, partial [Verrucomicrobia bacterium]|nr:hypothetical protein [Verrucomicrobiota bacterium]